MPGYKGHLFGAILPVTIVFLITPFVAFSVDETTLLVLACILGALAPDIDTRSKGRRLFFVLAFFALFVALVYASWYSLLALFIAMFIVFQASHRGRFHRFSVWLSLSVCLMMYWFSVAPKTVFFGAAFLVAFLAGIATHLILDRVRIR